MEKRIGRPDHEPPNHTHYFGPFYARTGHGSVQHSPPGPVVAMSDCCNICTDTDHYWTAEFLWWFSDPEHRQWLAELHEELAALRAQADGAA